MPGSLASTSASASGIPERWTTRARSRCAWTSRNPPPSQTTYPRPETLQENRMKRFALLPALALASGLAFAQTTKVVVPPGHAVATFAGGCFWCMEPPYDKLAGVSATISGYTAGRKVNPTYQEVSAGTTGHTEAVQVVYDPKQVSYEKLLEVFWVNVDPTV